MSHQFWHVGMVRPVVAAPIEAQGGSIKARALVNTSEVPLLSYRTTDLMGLLRFFIID